uniref:REG-2-like, HAD superfamily (Subfamily IA) hydrolase n=1 Tax=Cyanothece sp. (strain PCC 7425 / ATCC 29141) TaxID=395961 RepID=B8HWA7_CYAP4
MARPQVIFLDAVGTLFGVRSSVGEIYGDFARQVGVDVDPVALNRAFLNSFRAAPRAAFPGQSAANLPGLEMDWWEAIATDSFAQVGVLDQFTDFHHFFVDLFTHFATAAPWVVYEEVPQVLADWQAAEIQLGVVSNFDSRLYQVLQVLDLAQYFTSVTISTAVGAAKPEPGIFKSALEKYGCLPAQAWHIGDSWSEDVGGAIAAGLTPVWLNREAQSAPVGTIAMEITSLSNLLLPVETPGQGAS